MGILPLALLLAAGFIGYRLGRRDRPALTLHEAPRTEPTVVVPLRPTPSPAEDRTEVVTAAQELGRWLETAGSAPAAVSPATWDRISETASRIAAAAERLSTNKDA